MKLLVLLVVGLVAYGEAKLPSLKHTNMQKELKELKKLVAEYPLVVDHPMRKQAECDGSALQSLSVGTVDCGPLLDAFFEDDSDEEESDDSDDDEGMPDPDVECAGDITVTMQCLTKMQEGYLAIAADPVCIAASAENVEFYSSMACIMGMMSGMFTTICRKDEVSDVYCLNQLADIGIFDESEDPDDNPMEDWNTATMNMICKSTCLSGTSGTFIADFYGAYATAGTQCAPVPSDPDEAAAQAAAVAAVTAEITAMTAIFTSMFAGACEKNGSGAYCLPIVMGLTANDEEEVCGDIFDSTVLTALTATNPSCCGDLDAQDQCVQADECKAFMTTFVAGAGCCTSWFFEFMLPLSGEDGTTPTAAAVEAHITGCGVTIPNECPVDSEGPASQAAVTVVTLLCAVILAVVM